MMRGMGGMVQIADDNDRYPSAKDRQSAIISHVADMPADILADGIDCWKPISISMHVIGL
jgi:hypothetical protein